MRPIGWCSPTARIVSGSIWANPAPSPIVAKAGTRPKTDQPYETPATWAVGDASRLFVPLRQVDPEATYTVTMRLHPFAYPGSAAQTVTACVNGVESGVGDALR